MCTLLFLFLALADSPLPLDDDLAPLLEDRLFKTAEVAVQVVDLRTGEEVWSHGADTGLNPASTTKVLTTATALKHLGPSYTFKTDLLGSVAPDGAGVIAGDLIVKGGGDPTLVIEKVWKLARDLELNGVTKIDGDLVLDESFFGSDHALPGWNKAHDLERGPSYFPGLSALSLNFNTVAIVVRPGSAAGKPAVATLETETGAYLKLNSSLKTGAKGTRNRVDIEREVTKAHTSFSLSGSVPAEDRVRRYYRTIGNPTRYFGEAFQAMLQERDIEVTGKVRTGVTPEDAILLTSLRSPPLTTVLMDMNKYSSNFMAEQVLRTVGAEIEDEGSTAAGVRVVQRYMASIGVAEDTYEIKNGSGLAQKASLAPSALTAVLMDMAKDPRVGQEFKTSLAIAGWDGTLRRRLSDKPAQVRGKTGTLGGVHCLAGYVEADDGGLYAFAFLVNGIKGSSYKVKVLHDAFARRMFEVTTDGSADRTP